MTINEFLTYIGLVGSILLGISILPEVWLAVRQNKRRMNKITLILLILGSACSIIYNIFILKDYVLLINFITLFISSIFIVAKEKGDVSEN